MIKSRILITLFTLCFLHVCSQSLYFERTYDTLGSYYANCIKQTFDNGFITCGSSYSATAIQDAVVLKLDSIGNVSWVWNYSTAGTDGATHIEQLPDSNFAVYGFQSSSQGYKIFLAKVDPAGNLQWLKSYFLGY
jgi:hypothetical protein